jgi:hypothetical protein
MPRHCSICDHKDVEKIDMLLVNGETFQTISNNFNVSAQALQRHKASNHILDLLTKAGDIEEIASADNLMKQLSELQERALSLCDKAEAAGNTKAYGSPSQYLREIRETVKLLAELEGRLQTQAQINVNTQINVLSSPEWISLRFQILQAIEPFPEAKAALLEGLP